MFRLITATVLALFAATAFAQTDSVYQDNIVLVVDSSGSMNDRLSGSNETRMDHAKRAIIQVLRQVPEDTNVGILTFEGTIVPLGPVDMTSISQRVNAIRPGGGTPLGEFTKTGADMLLAQREKQLGYGSYRLIVVTDGQAGDENKLDKYSAEVVARGIRLDAIGVDMRANHSLARTATSYREANDAASLNQAVAEVFAEVGSGSGNVSADEAFNELSGLTPEFAAAMFEGFRNSGNHPIGTSPPKPKQTAVASPQSSQAQQNQQNPANLMPMFIIIASGAVVLVIILIAIFARR